MTFLVPCFALTVVLAQVAAGPGGPPKECAAFSTHGGSNMWERVKAPDLGRYCDLLSSAAAKLAGPAYVVTDVVAIADVADRLVTGRAAAPLLKGRALARLGQYAASLEALEEASRRDDAAFDDPEALLAWARVQSFAGHTAEALAAYRALMPRASVFSAKERGSVYVAAGMLAMSLGPQGVDESVSILRQARKDSRDVVSHVAALALALALDRAGQKAEATLVLSEVSHDNPPALLADPSAIESMGSTWDVEHAAMVALALDSVDPARAHREWTTYLEGPGGRGPWADHARQHTVMRRVPGVRGR